ncbi:hypothetical protein CCHL11_09855 [Colletotrichum chlorophyti]|uniref:Ubiquitin 3 binding protein But2 C-terminal domain-containing protein n=1 Tax=Colletotrichum chlorophyti TaxID=708187 RepID=A0A1Q8RM40_9PEZI|nr:hypothetical protein CCHL11_09855 [Colletotrichum chlorophyti]
MARLGSVLARVLSIAGSAVVNTTPTDPQRQQQLTECARVDAPSSLTWLLPDQPFEQEDPSAFFYVNQDIDASEILRRSSAPELGKQANRVAQLVTFGGVQGQEVTGCRLYFTMPEDPESWELIQREGRAAMMVFRVPTDEDDDAVQGDDRIGTIHVRPGTQAIDLGLCDGSGSFVFELADPGRGRVAFRQASEPTDGFGVFLGSGCPVKRGAGTEEL